MKGTNTIRAAGSLMLLVVLSEFCEARTSSDPPFPLLVTGRVANNAKLPAEIIAKAEKEVELIFQRIHVQVRWLNCSISSYDNRYPDPCDTPRGPADLILNLVKKSVPADYGLRPKAIGLAVNSNQGGVYAFVFCARVEGVVRDTQLPFSRVLSCAMAHEMGHLLMGERPHSSFGLMRSDWDARDIRSMAMCPLSFVRGDSDLIRLNLETRLKTVMGSNTQAIAQVQSKAEQPNGVHNARLSLSNRCCTEIQHVQESNRR